MNRYTVEVTPSNGDPAYYLEFCAMDENMVHRFMNDAAMMQYNGDRARLKIVFVLPWFPPDS